jgi:hypothetical protein
VERTPIGSRRVRAGPIRRSLAAVALLVALGAVACGDDGDDSAGPPSLDDPTATGQELANEFLTLVAEKDADGLEGFLSDAFIVQRANGTSSTKDAYLPDLPDVGEFETSNFTVVQHGNALVVAYDLAVQETIEGEAFATDPAPRLSTFVWDDGEWRLASHANFNVPEAESDQ